jgi:hypothetical protein
MVLQYACEHTGSLCRPPAGLNATAAAFDVAARRSHARNRFGSPPKLWI